MLRGVRLWHVLQVVMDSKIPPHIQHRSSPANGLLGHVLEDPVYYKVVPRSQRSYTQMIYDHSRLRGTENPECWSMLARSLRCRNDMLYEMGL